MANPQEQFAALQKANLDTTISLANAVLAGAERLAILQMATAKELLADNAKTARSLMAIKNPQELTAFQPVEPLLERALAYSRNVYEVTAQTQTEIAKVLEGRMKHLTATMNEAMETAAKAGPGSDVAMAAIKSAMAAANSAYENVQKMTKQVTELTEANITAATDVAKGGTKKKSTSKA
jgi:phasin family protein